VRAQACSLVVLALLGGGATASAGGVDARIGNNRVAMPEAETSYRLTLGGEASIAAARPPADPATSPNGRFRVERFSMGLLLRNRKTGASRTLTRDDPYGVAYWSSKGLLAYTKRVDRIERLVVLDPASGVRRVAVRRVCDVGASPWSPDGSRLAVAQAPPHQSCRSSDVAVAVSDTRSGRTRRVSMPYTEPIAWTGDGSKLLVIGRTASGTGIATLVAPDTGASRSVLPSIAALGASGEWSHGRRFFAVPGTENAQRAGLVVLDARLSHEVAAFTFGSAYAWAPSGQRLAVQMAQGIVVFDAPSARVVATIPVRAPYGYNVDWIRWDHSERSIVISAMPGLGHD
jgi:hypothetical protein